jgi:hypothetical protein
MLEGHWDVGLRSTGDTTVRKLILATTGILGVAALAFTASAAISSNVYIKKNDAFLLGGTQPEAFKVSGTNTGPVAVQVLARYDGSDTEIATIAPGAKFKQDFAKSEIAILRNTSGTQTAIVKVRITGYTKGLGMRYELPQD